MSNSNQDQTPESVERRDFLKQSGAAIIIGSIAAMGLGSTSRVLADSPGFARLSNAVSGKVSNNQMRLLDWTCDFYGTTCNNDCAYTQCDTSFVCANSVTCEVQFSCTNGPTDSSYGCTDRKFQCAGSGGEFSCTGAGAAFACKTSSNLFICYDNNTCVSPSPYRTC